MNLFHLRYFLDAAKFGSLSIAAKKNLVSQSAVSQAIRSLEMYFDEDILVHKKNSFELTPFGKEALGYASSILEKCDALKNLTENFSDTIRGEVSFGCTHSFASKYLHLILGQLKKMYPEVKPNCILGNSDVIKELVLKKEVEFGIIVDDLNLSSFSSEKIMDIKFRLYSLPHIELEPSLPIYVTRMIKPEVNSFVTSFRGKFGDDPKSEAKVLSWEVIKTFVELGYGAGVLPDYLVNSSEEGKKLKAFKFWSYSTNLCIIERKGRERKRAVEALTKVIKNILK